VASAPTPTDPVTTLVKRGPVEAPLDEALARARLREKLFGAPSEPVRVGRFAILRCLGEGGAGIVYAAHDPTLDRTVALKLMRPVLGGREDSNVIRRRLLQEARAAASLSHPNVVTVFEAGLVEDEVYLVMEMVEGETLRGWVEERTPDEIVGAYLQAGQGLAAAHDAGLVHGDFKADNVLMGTDERARVADFGLARMVRRQGAAEGEPSPPPQPSGPPPRSGDGGTSGSGDLPTWLVSEDTETSLVGFTPAYVSPEQLDASAATAASDQFSFAVSLFEALGESHPFGFERAGGRFPDFGGDKPVQWPENGIDEPLRPVLLRALALQPADRYRDMAELLADLRQAAGLDDGRADRSWLRSRPAVAGLFGIIAVLGALLAGIGVLGNRENDRLQPPPSTTTDLLSIAGAPVAADLAPDGSFLVHGDGTDLFERDVGGDLLAALTEGFDPRCSNPAISADGQRVAFSADGALYTLTLGRDVLPWKVTDDGHRPVWSPDGTAIAYSTSPIADLRIRDEFDSSPRIVHLEGEAAGTVVELEPSVWTDTVHVDWSPDGEWLVLSGGEGMYTVRPDGSGLNDLRWVGWSPRWAEDGRSIAFIGEHEGRHVVARVRFDGRTGEVGDDPEILYTIPPEAGYPTGIDWLDDRILLTTRSDRMDLFTVRLEPSTGHAVGEPAVLLESESGFVGPSLSVDGEWLAFTSFGANEDLYIAKVDGSELTRLSHDEFVTRFASWSPDGSRVLFSGKRGESSDRIWSVARDGSDLRDESGMADAELTHAIWSPDGTRLSVTGTGFWPSVIEPERAWVPQGLDQASEDTAGWVATDWSPDGRSLAVIHPAHGIGRMDIAARTVELVAAEQGHPLWMADGRRMIVGAKDRIFVLDTETGERSELLSTAPLQLSAIAPMTLSADDSALIYSAGEVESRLYWIEIEGR